VAHNYSKTPEALSRLTDAQYRATQEIHTRTDGSLGMTRTEVRVRGRRQSSRARLR
jgi:hypothetical protein